jgi:enediyne biosynthesis protein E4
LELEEETYLMQYFLSVFIALVALFSFSCQEREEDEDRTLFISLDAKSIGIDFENTLTYTEDFNVYLYRSFYNGAGTGLADLNNDGFLDVFFSGNMVDNSLYLGDGSFNFKDVTSISGVGSSDSWSTGVSIIDLNQDGRLDIYVCKSGKPDDLNRRNELFINMGNDENGIPIFKESAAEYGLDNLGYSIHAVFFDYDRDGDLDMYLSNNSINQTEFIMDANKGLREKVDIGGGDKFFRNDGNCFTDVTAEAGIYSSGIGFGLGIAVGDLNCDGWPDVYVANDFFEKDYLYINNKDGTFTESIDQMVSELSLGSMGVDIADMNNDGYPEIFVTEMLPKDESRLKTKIVFDNWDNYSLKVHNGYHHQFPRNTFQLNRGSVSQKGGVVFSEISRYAGVAATDWSWGVQMVDFDLDGKKEIFITNGIVKDLLDQDYIDFYSDPIRIRSILNEKGAVIKELIDNIPSKPLANFMFKQGTGLKYVDVASEWGMDQLGFSSGAAYGDIDNDGDLDLVVSNINGPPNIYKNTSKNKENHFISLALKNAKGATAVGAKATVSVQGIQYYQELYPMRGVMSVVDDRLNFGLGSNTIIDSIEIIWPDGTYFSVNDVAADQFVIFKQGNDNSNLKEQKIKINNFIFSDVTDRLQLLHVHKENYFVDFNKDKLLYHMISNEGPKIAVGDVNGDGRDDFFIGGAKDTPGSLYIQTDKGFLSTNIELFEKDKSSEDLRILFVDVDNDNDLDLLVSSGGYEFSNTSFSLLDRLYVNDGLGNYSRSSQILPSGNPVSTSVVINADFDLDGYQDLFFGGRVVQSEYGVPASSRLMKNDGNGVFSDVTSIVAKDLLDLGMVTDAVWIDFDKDGDMDLVVVGEWMPIRVFENQQRTFKEVTEKLGLGKTNGLWNTIIKKDLDGDGWDDLVVGNRGENTFFNASLTKPVQMYINDFDGNGSIEQVITRYNGDMSYPFAMKKDLTSQMPFLLKKYLKHEDYKEQNIIDIFTEKELENAVKLDVFQTKSVVLWNDAGSFSLQELPFEAQLSPIYSIYASDLNNDGKIDLVLGGNQINAKPQTGIYSANIGTVIIKSTGNREFETMDISESGIYEKGQIRDIKEILIDNKIHLLVAINNERLKIYEINKIE